MSARLDCMQWSVLDAEMLLLKKDGVGVAHKGCTWKVDIILRWPRLFKSTQHILKANIFGRRTLGREGGSETRHLWRVPRKLLLLTNFFGSLDMEDDSSGFYISRGSIVTI